MSSRLDVPGAPIRTDEGVANAKIQFRTVTTAESKLILPKVLNERFGCTVPWKPRCPNLDGRSLQSLTPGSSGIHKQVTKPPRATVIGERQPQKPNFVAAFHPQRRIDCIQGCSSLHRKVSASTLHGHVTDPR